MGAEDIMKWTCKHHYSCAVKKALIARLLSSISNIWRHLDQLLQVGLMLLMFWWIPSKASSDKLRAADQQLRNDVIDLLASWNVGWAPDTVGTIGERCIKTIVSALWYLDLHHDRFTERSLHIPQCFAQFKGYNDWRRKKERQPKLHQVDIDTSSLFYTFWAMES